MENEPLNSKPCVKCGSTERYKPRPGEETGACKACHKARDKKRRKNNPEKKYKQNKAWRENNADKHRAHVRAWHQANPEKFAAHQAIKNAVRRGDLPRVSTCDCRDCGIQAADYHHEDYSKPLEVEPLCRLCHKKRHNSDN